MFGWAILHYTTALERTFTVLKTTLCCKYTVLANWTLLLSNIDIVHVFALLVRFIGSNILKFVTRHHQYYMHSRHDFCTCYLLVCYSNLYKPDILRCSTHQSSCIAWNINSKIVIWWYDTQQQRKKGMLTTYTKCNLELEFLRLRS